MSCTPSTAWITGPDPRKSSALKKACVARWKIAAAGAPTPRAAHMYPRWLRVEYAVTRLMSIWTRATVAAKMAVMAPTTPTTASDGPAAAKSGIERATRYTPEVTIVAAWMRAETGVGPSIASGSHE